MSDTRQPTAIEDPAGPEGATRTFAAARRHSGRVRVLKFAIPVFAVTAVVSVIVWSFFNPFGRIPGLSVGPISFSGSKIAMETPRLTGFRKDGRGYEVTATVAYQDLRSPNVLELKNMTGHMASDHSGGLIHLVSDEGVFDSGKEHLDLAKNIRISTDKGEEMLMRSASIDIKVGHAVSREPVSVRTPTMTVDGDTFEAADGGKLLTFVGRVHVNLAQGGDNKPTASSKRSEDVKVADATPSGPAIPTALVSAVPSAAVANPARTARADQGSTVLAAVPTESRPAGGLPTDAPLPPPAPRGRAESGQGGDGKSAKTANVRAAGSTAAKPSGQSSSEPERSSEPKAAVARPAVSAVKDGSRFTSAEPAGRP